MMIFPLIFKVSRHMRHKKIALSCIYLLIESIVLCNNAHNRDGTLKTKLENFHNIFLNSDFSLNICSIFAKFLENVFLLSSRGKRVSKL